MAFKLQLLSTFRRQFSRLPRDQMKTALKLCGGGGSDDVAGEDVSYIHTYRVTVVVADLGWVDLKWDVPTSCLGSRQLQ